MLERSGEPLHLRAIAERAISDGLLRSAGKTPENTMAAQLYTEIREHGDQSTFVRVGRGLIGLRASPSRTGDDTAPVPARQPRATALSIAHDPAERLAAEVLTSQHESRDSVRFEKVLTEAFAFPRRMSNPRRRAGTH